jgi:sec-independent protein translocase protein TatB
MSFSETIFLFFLALIIFGPKKLPEIARQVGKALNEFKRASNEFKAQIEQEISHLEVENKQTILPPVQPPEGSTGRSLHGKEGSGKEGYADAELHHVEAPALTEGSEGASTPGENSPDEVASSPAVSGGAASGHASSDHASSDHASSDQPSVATEQAPPADPSEAVTASDPVGAAVAPESRSSESHFSEPHA